MRLSPPRRHILMGSTAASVLFVSFVLSTLAQSAAGQEPIVRLIRPQLDESVLAVRAALRPGPVRLRGYQAPILAEALDPWPTDVPAASAEPLRRAADLVALRLAADGLLPTLASAIQTIGAEHFVYPDTARIKLLRSSGLPMDLVRFYRVVPGAPDGPESVVRHIAEKLAAGVTLDALQADLRSIPFEFRPTRADFALATETGEGIIDLFRLQLPSGSDTTGEKDGNAMDIARQLIAACPRAMFLIIVSDAEATALETQARPWRPPGGRPITLLATPWPADQWAQDNGKSGLVGSAQSGRRQLATLLPRYASRGEERTSFEPAESFNAEALAAVGHELIHSPLVFQGGNLMAVRHPKSGTTTLLIGEAEVARNTALGLRTDEVLAAFRVECAVDQTLVLPAVSFHLDFEVSLRAHGDQLIAFVNDDRMAAEAILGLALAPLAAAGTIDKALAEEAGKLLAMGDSAKALELVAGPVARQADRTGYFPRGLAERFAAPGSGLAVANFQRVLLAIDTLANRDLAPGERPPDRFAGAYVQALQRRLADRALLRRMLEKMGCEVVGIPSLADEARSINYLNGFHEPGRYLMPAYGGFFAPLDELAKSALSKALGDKVEVVPIYCAQSQTLLGAIHCAASAYPLP